MGGIHSIIDLTLSSPNVELNWCLLRVEMTGSDHELIAWEVLGNPCNGCGSLTSDSEPGLWTRV